MYIECTYESTQSNRCLKLDMVLLLCVALSQALRLSLNAAGWQPCELQIERLVIAALKQGASFPPFSPCTSAPCSLPCAQENASVLEAQHEVHCFRHLSVSKLNRNKPNLLLCTFSIPFSPNYSSSHSELPCFHDTRILYKIKVS